MDNRRNVVVIMCDQLRADFLHAYGADFIPTPNIDELASRGVVYDNAITASTVCAPARMSFMTGEHVSRHDGWTNLIPVDDRCEFIPDRLNEAGYMTAAVGNYDHSPYDATFGYKYLKRDLDGTPGPSKIYEHLDDYMNYLKKKHPEVKQCHDWDEDMYFNFPEEDFCDYWSGSCAVEFIESYAKTRKAPDGTSPEKEDAPFYLYCGFFSPHAPLTPPREVKGTVDESKIPDIIIQPRPDDDIPEVELYRRAFLNSPEELRNEPEVLEQRRKDRVRYCELIVEVDKQVGRIIKALKDNGIYENTTIIFTSDHGSVENDYNVLTKGPWPYTAQLFIPMIVSNAPGIEAGSRCDALCGNLDVGATVLDVAGDSRQFGLSRSMIGLANGKVAEREVNLSEFCDSVKTLVDKQYTFTYYPFMGKTTLFDRINDPEARVNLSGKKEYEEIEKSFLMHAVDYMVLSKGKVRVEAHDLMPEMKAGIAKKNPDFMDTFEVAYPLSNPIQIERLKAEGLDYEYNEFCREKEFAVECDVYYQNEKK